MVGADRFAHLDAALRAATAAPPRGRDRSL